jgi:hypothetical protein
VRTVDDVRRLLNMGPNRPANSAALASPIRDASAGTGRNASWWRLAKRRSAEDALVPKVRVSTQSWWSQKHWAGRGGLGHRDGLAQRGEILLTSMERTARWL